MENKIPTFYPRTIDPENRSKCIPNFLPVHSSTSSCSNSFSIHNTDTSKNNIHKFEKRPYSRKIHVSDQKLISVINNIKSDVKELEPNNSSTNTTLNIDQNFISHSVSSNNSIKFDVYLPPNNRNRRIRDKEGNIKINTGKSNNYHNYIKNFHGANYVNNFNNPYNNSYQSQQYYARNKFNHFQENSFPDLNNKENIPISNFNNSYNKYNNYQNSRIEENVKDSNCTRYNKIFTNSANNDINTHLNTQKIITSFDRKFSKDNNSMIETSNYKELNSNPNNVGPFQNEEKIPNIEADVSEGSNKENLLSISKIINSNKCKI
jgi:hypothetical protein